MKSLHQCSNEQWTSIEKRLSHAIVYMDNDCAELLHWNGGMTRFLQAGAKDVRELSSFESGSKSDVKAMFILSTPLYDVGGEIIQDIIKASHFQYVVVVSTIGSHVHLYHKTGTLEGNEQTLMEKFEENLLIWMGNVNYTAEVVIIPLFTAQITNNLFVTPAFSSLYPLLSTDIKRVELSFNKTLTNKAERKTFDQLSDIENGYLPKPYITNLKMFVSSLNGLLEKLDVREDIYYIGHTSRFVAHELDIYSPARNRRKVAKERASIVFIDRTLDLSSCSTSQYDCLLDEIMNILPRVPGHHNDVMVDMSSLCSVHGDVGKTVIVPGSLSRSINTTPQSSILNSLVNVKIKEGLMDVNRQLVEAASSEKLPVKLTGKPGRITHQQLSSTLQLFQSNYRAIQPNLDILQVAMATVQSLSKKTSHHDNIVGIEKRLLQMADDKDSPSLLLEILKILKTESVKPVSERDFSLDDILALLIYSYSLCGADFIEEEESQFQEELINVIVQDKDNLSPAVKSIVGETVNKSIVMAIVEDVWSKLVAIGTAREDLDQFSSIIERGGVMSPTECKPLLNQIVEDIVNPSKPDLIDIKHKQSGMKDLLKSGFGLFMTVYKPRPSDHPLLILYIIGGITPTEVKHIQDIVNKTKPDIQVLIGSTRLCTKEDITLSSFSSDNLSFNKS
ncbi:hypothetical protein LOTGIDRAFT_235701 [Lottia gigantea]|uniref:Sec1 family domain-containing protein 2 n=1 Tax=Lottia gigantea TaxID=225164 RepID=V3Z5D0_LOTGI|nr:hypothetical protein LOTGIDRAFT_235701 [Lottia gigantea]ESO85938.1 hypothetical protein LOTGIDRAFT_235701 [Lottia gigantea]